MISTARSCVVLWTTVLSLYLSQLFPKTIGHLVCALLCLVEDLTSTMLRPVRALAVAVVVPIAAISDVGLGAIAYLVAVSFYTGNHDLYNAQWSPERKAEIYR